MGSVRQRFTSHPKGWITAGVGVAIAGLILVLVLSDESPSHASARPTTNPSTGLSSGVKVAHPPGPTSGGASAPSGLTSGWTGTCPVQVKNHYIKYDWNEQTKCAGGWGSHAQLVTIRNASNLPVFVNEWYGSDWHGQTTILAGQSVIMPVWGTIFSTSLYVGACWVGSGGPGTCQNGTPNQTANVEIVSWEEIPQGQNSNGLMFVRDENSMGISARNGSSYTAVNLGDYPVQLHWPELGRDRWVDLPLKGRIENIPPGDIYGRKEIGTGAVALVSIKPIPRPDGEDLYSLVSPSERGGVPPFAYMTWLNGSWCSVHLENLGPKPVILQSWNVPYVGSGGKDLFLVKGASGTLVMSRGTLFLTGHVGTGSTGEFTLVKATQWKQCR